MSGIAVVSAACSAPSAATSKAAKPVRLTLQLSTEELTELLLEQLDLLLDVGCFTELLRCCVDHRGRSVIGFGGRVKPVVDMGILANVLWLIAEGMLFVLRPRHKLPLATGSSCQATYCCNDYQRVRGLPPPRSVKQGAVFQNPIAYGVATRGSSMSTSGSEGNSGVARSILVTACFLLVGFVATYALLAPSPKPATAPLTEFSAVRALEHSKVIAREPHPMGTPADDLVRTYIIRKLTEMGVEVQEQPSRNAHRGTIEVATNVI